MTEEKQTNQKSCCSFCSFDNANSQCGGHTHKGCRIFRWILGAVILWIVFMAGVKVGEFKGIIQSEYGYGFGRHQKYGMRMMDSQNNYSDYGRGYRMMNGGDTGMRSIIVPGPDAKPLDGKLLQ